MRSIRAAQRRHRDRKPAATSNGQDHGGRTSTKPAGHVSQSCAQEQGPADDLSGQRRQAAGRRDLVRQFLRAAAARRAFATRLQARDLDDHAGPADPDVRGAARRPRRRQAAEARRRRAGHSSDDDVARATPDAARRRAPSAAATRALVVGPYPSQRRRGAGRRAIARSPEARLEEARRARPRPSISTSSTARRSTLDAIRPATYLGKGKVEELARLVAGRGDRARRHGLRAVAGAAAQPREGVRGQGHRPHRADPRDLRPARAHPGGRAAGRARPSRLSEVAPRALLDPSRAPARRLRLPRRPRRNPDRDRPPPDRGAHGAHRARPRQASSGRARCNRKSRRATCRIRSSRWSATPTPASRPCSTA